MCRNWIWENWSPVSGTDMKHILWMSCNSFY